MTVALLPPAPTQVDGAISFPTIANTFFVALQTMVTQVDALPYGATPIDPLRGMPDPSDFVSGADAFVAALPPLVTQVNVVIADLSLSCPTITALPSAPSRQHDANFAVKALTFLGALPLLRSQLNDFITALNAHAPATGYFDKTTITFDSTTHTWDAN